MQTAQTTSKIYVACLSAYNNGHLHGEWIDANQEVHCIHEDIQKMLKCSPVPCAEEWAIHDYEGFERLNISEYESIESVANYAQLIMEHGAAYAAYAGYIGTEYATEEGFEEAYQGEWESEEAFAEHIADETMDIPEHLQFYLDYEKFARDLFINDYFSEEGGNFKIFVFRHI